jgi:hypothetical protein
MSKAILQFDVNVFEKSGEGEKSRRIGGYATTEHLDRQGEILVQKGLDFAEFLAHGWFNDNHDKTSSGVVGYPVMAEFHKGKGWYVEGYLLKGYKKADDLWELATALQKSDRKLGFSVEGNGVKRDPRNENKILKASIKHVAITHVPVNTNCTMEVLAKSLCKHPEAASCVGNGDCCEKALEAGYGSDTSATGGSALRTESIDGVKICDSSGKPCNCGGGCHKSDDQAITVIMARGYTKEQAEIIWKRLKPLTTKEEQK